MSSSSLCDQSTPNHSSLPPFPPQPFLICPRRSIFTKRGVIGEGISTPTELRLFLAHQTSSPPKRSESGGLGKIQISGRDMENDFPHFISPNNCAGGNRGSETRSKRKFLILGFDPPPSSSSNWRTFGSPPSGMVLPRKWTI